VPLCANEAGDLRLHERLGEHPDSLAEDVPILLLEERANDADGSILGFAIASTRLDVDRVPA
jgi:hypothetical protein